jgi:hypothetical protein
MLFIDEYDKLVVVPFSGFVLSGRLLLAVTSSCFIVMFFSCSLQASTLTPPLSQLHAAVVLTRHAHVRQRLYLAA